MGYKSPQSRNAQSDSGSKNAFDDIQKAKYAPNKFDQKYNGNIGSYVELRIISLLPDDIRQFPSYKATIRTPKQKKLISKNFPMAIGDIAGFVDANDTKLEDCKIVDLFRVPVFVYATVDENGKRTEVKKLMYIEFTGGLESSLNNLKTQQDGACAFNDESGRPEYDIRLKVVPGTSTEFNKMYAFEPILIGKGGTHPHFGPSAEAVLKKIGCEKVLDTDWDELQENMSKLPSVEDVKKELNRTGGSGESATSHISERPDMREAEPAATEVDSSEDANYGFSDRR